MSVHAILHVQILDEFIQLNVMHCSTHFFLVFEDSFHAFVHRNADELRGRLHVTFQNEEGVDAGGTFLFSRNMSFSSRSDH